MSEGMPSVASGDWITVSGRPAVVSMLFGEVAPDQCEVVWLDYLDRAVNQNATWKDGIWQLAGPDDGGYADNKSRLAEVVRILRNGPHHVTARGPSASPRMPPVSRHRGS